MATPPASFNAGSQPSTSSRPLCSICNHQYSIYTCPRCSTRTCSLPCSAKHKADHGCNGERNKASYVPMNEYGWGAMMNDYVFLEDVGRQVSDWGKEIVRGGFDLAGSSRGRGMAFRGRGRSGNARGSGRTKRDVLRLQLGNQDIEVELLPNGMEKRKLNQSIWDFKKQTAYITIDYRIHRPRDPAAPSSQPLEAPIKLLTHRNDVNKPLLELLRRHITDRAKTKSPCPVWISTLLYPDSEDPDAFHAPIFVMRAATDPEYCTKGRGNIDVGYYKLDHSRCLLDSLRGTSFIEYPVIDVWETFHGTIVSPSGDRRQPDEPETGAKRRRIDVRAGRKAINSLLGGYGSDDNDESSSRNVMSTLGQYDGSDEEGSVPGSELDAEGETDEDMELDPSVVLELIKKARGEMGLQMDDGDDNVDWGDSDGEE